jgi:hypothetical protein
MNLGTKLHFHHFFSFFLRRRERRSSNFSLERENYCWRLFQPPKRSIFMSNSFIWWGRSRLSVLFPWKWLENHIWAREDFLFRFYYEFWGGFLWFWCKKAPMMFPMCFVSKKWLQNECLDEKIMKHVFLVTLMAGWWEFKMMSRLFFDNCRPPYWIKKKITAHA